MQKSKQKEVEVTYQDRAGILKIDCPRMCMNTRIVMGQAFKDSCGCKS